MDTSALLMTLLAGLLAASLALVAAAFRRAGAGVSGAARLAPSVRGWPRRWALLLAAVLLARGLASWERSGLGLEPWPHWPTELPLAFVLCGLAALFARASH